MAAKITNFYAGGNTARGFYSLYETNITDLTKLFILKGGSQLGKTTIMKQIGQAFHEKGYEVEYMHAPSNNQCIEAVKIPALKMGMGVETILQGIDVDKIVEAIEYVELNKAFDSSQLIEHKETLLQLKNQASETFQKAYYLFYTALKIHDEWEKIYIENMNFVRANEVTKQLTQQLFGESKGSGNAKVVHRFLGAATPKGAVDFVPNLTEDTPDRYFIKGRPGSGKSTLLKKLVTHAESNGFHVEVYHCGFDPNSLDMVIVRELGFAIFDSTAPHEYFPSRKGDKVIDMYEELIQPGTDEKYANEISEVAERYKNKMQEAISYLAKAKSYNDDAEVLIQSTIKVEVLNQMTEELKDVLLERLER